MFYLLHIALGRLFYADYNPLTQAVSDLAAVDSPARKIALTFFVIYNIFNTIFCITFFMYFRAKLNRMITWGAAGFCITAVSSLAGFTLFPLSKTNTFFTLDDIGHTGIFQDKIHILTVLIIIVFTMASTVLYIRGFLQTKDYRYMGIISVCELVLLVTGTVSLCIAPKAWFGIAERINIYSILIYTGILSWWMYHGIKTKKFL